MPSGETLDLVLINPGGRTSIYQALASELAAIEPPVWAGLIAQFVRLKGLSVQIIDADALDLAPEQVADRVSELSPRLVGVVAYGHQPSASTHVMPSAGAICSALKQTAPESKILLLGGHAAALPERTLRDEAADFVCTGEGPYTVVELAEAMSKTTLNLDSVRGLCYRDGDAIVRTSPAPLVIDLDAEMPGMAWDLLPMDKYRAHNWHCFDGLQRRPYAAIYTTLGCPYKCSFCCIQAPFKEGEELAGHKASVNTYRRWSVDVVVAQIDTLVNDYGVRNIKVADEMFVLNKRHVLGICDAIIERGYDLNFWAYARVDTVQESMIEKLKRAGFNWLALGIEAGNRRVLDDVDKGYSQDKIFDTVQALREQEIYVIANYIFGLPEDDMESMQQTLDLALELNCEFANFYCAMAYPGSKLYADALRQRLPLPSDWAGYSQHGIETLPLPTKQLSAGDVIRFRDEAFNIYYSNPAYLNMIEDTFGKETVDHISAMASHKLERAYADRSFSPGSAA